MRILHTCTDCPLFPALEHGAVIVTKDEDFPERSLRSPAPRIRCSTTAALSE